MNWNNDENALAAVNGVHRFFVENFIYEGTYVWYDRFMSMQ